MPLTIDSGVMSVAIAIGANHSRTLNGLLVQIMAAVAGTSIVASCIWVTYRYA